MFSHSQLYLDQNSLRGENVETEEGVEETSASRTFAFLWTIFGKMCKLPSKKPEKRVFHYSDTKKERFRSMGIRKCNNGYKSLAKRSYGKS